MSPAPGSRAPGRLSRLSTGATRVLAIACVLALAASGVVWWLFIGANQRQVTAYFGAGVGMYPGGDVRVLGVKVGEIDDVVPQGRTVRISMSVDRDVELPADARAAVVSPSVVADRYVQFTPVYTGGPTMRSGAVIPHERTATPVEVDQLYKSLDQVTQALGPQGANKEGALTDLLNTGAANLRGNGQKIGDTLRNLGEATKTLSGNREDVFGTIDNLQKFTGMLNANDTQVRRFNDQLAQVSGELSGERDDLGVALSELSTALGQVQKFVADNRGRLHSNVDKLTGITQVLVKQRQALAESLDVAPLALGNVQNAYNAASGTLDTRANLNELSQPPLVGLCKMTQQATPGKTPKELADVCKQLGPVTSGQQPMPNQQQTSAALQQGKVPQLPLPVLGTLPGGNGGGQ